MLKKIDNIYEGYINKNNYIYKANNSVFIYFIIASTSLPTTLVIYNKSTNIFSIKSFVDTLYGWGVELSSGR